VADLKQPGGVITTRYAYGERADHGYCVIVGAYDCPTFILKDVNGKEFPWPQHMCDLVNQLDERSFFNQRIYELEQKIKELTA
jgi:hypothetical protein